MLKCSQVNVTVRKAKVEDMGQVFKLIKELAEFEKLESQIRIDEKVLIKDGFENEHPSFECMVAEISDGHIMGYALYYKSYSTWLGETIFLEDLYIQQAYRGLSVGKHLFMAVAKHAYELPSKRLDFHVLSWNPAIEFYKRAGAINLTTTEKWQLFRLDETAMKKIFDKYEKSS